MTFTGLMQSWKAKKAELAEIERQIQAEVMALEKTVTLGTVRASYSGGRKTYDYEGACKDVPQVVLDAYTTTIPASRMVDYKALCDGEEIEAKFDKSKPKVTLKLIEAKKTVDLESDIPV